jgi:hypothetical protein
MAGEGRPVEYIAERINSRPEEVRQWLKESEQAKTEAQNRLRRLECQLTRHCGICRRTHPSGRQLRFHCWRGVSRNLLAKEDERILGDINMALGGLY